MRTIDTVGLEDALRVIAAAFGSAAVSGEQDQGVARAAALGL
ncbi:hypothetical protein Acsp06_44480 [Actinomycetospora sp. NBRC 106375]|nr:hypothetical protein [Actinomycetospora sp. NBRC 106375]GLZ48263.1 hypothetical protein Acsp06_44480 [Actinomycetospora sp. NBRC 106375]